MQVDQNLLITVLRKAKHALHRLLPRYVSVILHIRPIIDHATRQNTTWSSVAFGRFQFYYPINVLFLLIYLKTLENIGNAI